jgi:hypothetical protein
MYGSGYQSFRRASRRDTLNQNTASALVLRSMREAIGHFLRYHSQIMRSPAFTTPTTLSLRLKSATNRPLQSKHNRLFSSDFNRDAQFSWKNWGQVLYDLIPREDVPRAIEITEAAPKFAIEKDFKLLLEESDSIP